MTEKWALITGATSGIGWATALRLAQQGYCILAMGRRAERLRDLQGVLSKNAPQVQVKTVGLDLTDRQGILSWIENNADLCAKVEVLVNNAGLAKGVDKMQDAHLDDWESMIDTNIKGLLFMTRGLLPFMVKQKRGHIVNLGSVSGRWVYPGGGVYCATKFAVRALSEGLRLDLLGTGLRVTNIEPGMVHTEFSEVRLNDKKSADRVYAGMEPLAAEDIAETIAWCVSRPSHVNIQELVIYPTDQAAVGFVHRKSEGEL